MGDDIIIGYTDNKDYALYGKLSDGTPIYKYQPKEIPVQPIFEKVKVEEVISKYNLSTNLKITDTTDYNSLLKKAELKNNQNTVSKKPIVTVEVKPPSETPFYFTENKPKDIPTVDESSGYINVLNEQVKREQAKQDKITNLKENHLQKLKEVEARKEEDRQKAIKCVNETRSNEDKRKGELENKVQSISDSLITKYFIPEKEKKIEPVVEIDIPELPKTTTTILDVYRKAKEQEPFKQILSEQAINKIAEKFYENIAKQTFVRGTPVPDTVSNYLTPSTGTAVPTPTVTPDGYIQPVSERDEREELRDQIRRGLIEEHKKKIENRSVENITDSKYYKDNGELVTLPTVEPTTYLDLFKAEQAKLQESEDKLSDVREKHKRVIEAELEEKTKSAQLYIKQVAFFNERELQKLRKVEEEFKKAEAELSDEYKGLLFEQAPENDFYDTLHDYEASDDEKEHEIVVKDVTVGKSVRFKYVGKLSSFKLSGYRLKIFSITRKTGEKGGFINHHYITYDIRDFTKIKLETYTFTKWDAELLTESDRPASEYATGSSATNTPFPYGQLVWAYQNPTPITFLTNQQHPISVSEVDTTLSSDLHLIASAGDFTNLYLGRVFNSEGSFTVEWAAVSSTTWAANRRAETNIDFIPASGSVTWADGDTGYKQLTGIKILEDYESESLSRIFNIQITNIRSNTPALTGSVRQTNQSIDAHNAQFFGTQVGMESTLSAEILPKHHGVFTFVSGIGSATSSQLDGWNSSIFGNSLLSAHAPGGGLGGVVTIGVERLSGTYGNVTVRCLLSAAKPNFAYPTDLVIGQGAEGYFGEGAYNYPSEDAQAEVAWRSPMVGGTTYSNDPLSGQLQTLTWTHGESGVKYIRLQHPYPQPYGVGGGDDYPRIWYGAYLTFNTSTFMGLCALGSGIDSTRMPTPCAAIIDLRHGRANNQHNTDAINTTRLGSVNHPFWVAIDTDNVDRYPRFFTLNITMEPGFGNPQVGKIYIYDELGSATTTTLEVPVTAIDFTNRSHGTHNFSIPANLITDTSKYVVVYEKSTESGIVKDWRYGNADLATTVNTTLPNVLQRNYTAHIIELVVPLSAGGVTPGIPIYNGYIFQGFSGTSYNIETITVGTHYFVFDNSVSEGTETIYANIVTSYAAQNSLPGINLTMPYSLGGLSSIMV